MGILDDILSSPNAQPTYTGPGYEAPSGSPAAAAAENRVPNIFSMLGGKADQLPNGPAPPSPAAPEMDDYELYNSIRNGRQISQQAQDLAKSPGSNLAQSAMDAANGPQRGGLISRMLRGFFYGGGQAMLKDVGLPTDFDLRRQKMAELEAHSEAGYRQQMGQAAVQNADTNEQYRRFQQDQAQQMIELPNGARVPFALAQRLWPELVKQQTQLQVASTKAGMPIALDENTAQLLNIDPKLVGQQLNTYQWGSIQKALSARGYHTADLGSEGMWVLDKGGQKIHQVTKISPGMERATAFAGAKAANTPFQTFDQDGNLVTTSQADAIATGAPAAQTYNSLYGPTSATKTSGQAAQGVASHIDEYQQAVRNLAAKGQLGPVMGRLNEYLNKGYGGNDPDIASFVMNTKLLKSGTLKAHFGARGGQGVLASFDQALNTAQGPDAIIGATNAIRTWLNTYGDLGTFQGPHGPIASKGAASLSRVFKPKSGGNTAPPQPGNGSFDFSKFPERK